MTRWGVVIAAGGLPLFLLLLPELLVELVQRALHRHRVVLPRLLCRHQVQAEHVGQGLLNEAEPLLERLGRAAVELVDHFLHLRLALGGVLVDQPLHFARLVADGLEHRPADPVRQRLDLLELALDHPLRLRQMLRKALVERRRAPVALELLDAAGERVELPLLRLEAALNLLETAQPPLHLLEAAFVAADALIHEDGERLVEGMGERLGGALARGRPRPRRRRRALRRVARRRHGASLLAERQANQQVEVAPSQPRLLPADHGAAAPSQNFKQMRVLCDKIKPQKKHLCEIIKR